MSSDDQSVSAPLSPWVRMPQRRAEPVWQPNADGCGGRQSCHLVFVRIWHGRRMGMAPSEAPGVAHLPPQDQHRGGGTARTLPDEDRVENPIDDDIQDQKQRRKTNKKLASGSRCWEGGKREVNEEEELELELERELDPTGAYTCVRPCVSPQLPCTQARLLAAVPEHGAAAGDSLRNLSRPLWLWGLRAERRAVSSTGGGFQN